MDQADKTDAATKKYDKSVQEKAPADVQKNLHDAKVWEETKTYALGYTTTDAANKKLAEQNTTRP
jgi:hypothetical protein